MAISCLSQYFRPTVCITRPCSLIPKMLFTVKLYMNPPSLADYVQPLATHCVGDLLLCTFLKFSIKLNCARNLLSAWPALMLRLHHTNQLFTFIFSWAHYHCPRILCCHLRSGIIPGRARWDWTSVTRPMRLLLCLQELHQLKDLKVWRIHRLYPPKPTAAVSTSHLSFFSRFDST